MCKCPLCLATPRTSHYRVFLKRNPTPQENHLQWVVVLNQASEFLQRYLVDSGTSRKTGDSLSLFASTGHVTGTGLPPTYLIAVESRRVSDGLTNWTLPSRKRTGLRVRTAQSFKHTALWETSGRQLQICCLGALTTPSRTGSTAH